ncbi:MAG: hypothetical protein BWK80_37755 [Desulfobacteraceae bacterium IS3]|nr:MAG: hypothetical protein BWK80_37755 [Desulfobacteraceae bacterium IS3]
MRLKKVTQSFKIYLCGTLRLINRKVTQSSRKVSQSFKIYLCGTLRFPLRNFAVKNALSAVEKKQVSTA